VTRVELTFRLRDIHGSEQLLERIARAQATYGIFRIQLGSNLDEVRVEYDATRLSPEDALAVFTRVGIPVQS
jgi:hypothetical protein